MMLMTWIIMMTMLMHTLLQGFVSGCSAPPSLTARQELTYDKNVACSLSAAARQEFFHAAAFIACR